MQCSRVLQQSLTSSSLHCQYVQESGQASHKPDIILCSIPTPVWAQVIYGDTDSIMVATGAQDLQAAGQLAGRIKREVNKRYRLLEIEEDGLFKRMLLLKKKKYAALKLVREPDGSWSEVRPCLA